MENIILLLFNSWMNFYLLMNLHFDFSFSRISSNFIELLSALIFMVKRILKPPTILGIYLNYDLKRSWRYIFYQLILSNYFYFKHYSKKEIIYLEIFFFSRMLVILLKSILLKLPAHREFLGLLPVNSSKKIQPIA